MASGASSTARDRPSASTRRPSQSVLSTSMVLPLRILSTSPGLTALPPGMFSVVGANADDADADAERAAGTEGRDDGRRAAHVGLHRHHPLEGLEGEATGVEGDALAHEGDGRDAAVGPPPGLGIRRLVDELDEPWRLRRARGHAQAGPRGAPRRWRPRRGSSRRVTRALGDLGRHLGKARRGERAGRLVGQVSSEPCRVRDHAAPLQPELGGRDVLRGDDDRERLERVRVARRGSGCSGNGPPRTPRSRPARLRRPRCRGPSSRSGQGRRTSPDRSHAAKAAAAWRRLAGPSRDLSPRPTTTSTRPASPC